MIQWLWAFSRLLIAAYDARCDARVRFLQAEVRLLRSRLSGNRLILTPRERDELLALGEAIDHRVKDILGVVSIQTYRRWLRERREGRQARRVGRRGISDNLRQLIQRLARENPQWGCRRIVGELVKLRRTVSRSTVRRVVSSDGSRPDAGGGQQPAPDRHWSRFVHRHLDTLVACDFFTKPVLTWRGMRTAYCLFFIHLGSRRVHLSPPTFHPSEAWLARQQAALVSWCEQQEFSCHQLIHDRDAKFTRGFDVRLRASGMRVIRTPVQAPNANAFAESWVATVKRECLNHFVCFGLEHLDHIGQIYATFYNHERPHQGRDNRVLAACSRDGPIAKDSDSGSFSASTITCRSELCGLLKSYHRVAA